MTSEKHQQQALLDVEFGLPDPVPDGEAQQGLKELPEVMSLFWRGDKARDSPKSGSTRNKDIS